MDAPQKTNSTIFPEYQYDLPDELVARVPISPRDSSRLFVYDCATDSVTVDHFSALGKHLPPRPIIVLNETRVKPARVTLKKKTGGNVTVLFLVNEPIDGLTIRGLVDRRVSIGDDLVFPAGEMVTAISHDAQYFTFRLHFPLSILDALLDTYGVTPLPKYLGTSALDEGELRDRYQTVFAKEGASVAAPTASLHFTPELLDDLAQSGASFAQVRLDVGLGTFSPVTHEQMAHGRLHEEYFSVSDKTARLIGEGKQSGRAIVAVGTTTVRVLESSADKLLAGDGLSGSTSIFIRQPFQFKVVDALLTNFHLPQTSLMALVDAFLLHKGARRRIISLYKEAIAKQFRFYSFGDAMLIR